ncbi:hypothetical protein [Paraburkholderia sp. J10-1]|uniref:hypothetical protein n=1 Tax=Paraburkholderia sp. J10-1 TaxID=2805430 RepID=UPI002AB7E9E2|nr:hypothetical protein [Paraburkholderia sp. J10-1]
MAYSRDDFVAALSAEASKYPLAAQYYQAGDPRLLMNLGAMATMLTMISQQVDLESMEVFNRVRDTTVLADASVKGILPFARPPRLTLAITNDAASGATLSVVVGRRLLDQQGLVYVAESEVTIAPGASGKVNVKQMTTRTWSHFVQNSTPFYAVQVPVSSDSDITISGLLVSVDGAMQPYTPEFANLAPDEPGYALETDQFRRLNIKFGWEKTFGVQPANGSQIDLTIEETHGATTLAVNSTFTFESVNSAADKFATIKLASVIFPGADQVDIETMREWSRYPSTYDATAVYLGNFDFLIRRNIFPLRFLSVWNEQIEEAVRGPSVSNINVLFIAVRMDGVDTAWLKREIARVVAAADNSYRLRFVNAIDKPLPLSITASVSIVHDPADVEAQIRSVVYSLYGSDAPAAKQGMLALNVKRIADALRSGVVALQDDASDVQISVQAAGVALPEQYRYVSPTSLVVQVTQSTYNDGLWSH